MSNKIKSSGQIQLANKCCLDLQRPGVSESDSINDEFWSKTWLQSYFSSALGSGLLKTAPSYNFQMWENAQSANKWLCCI